MGNGSHRKRSGDMTHDELLERLHIEQGCPVGDALLAVVELHRPVKNWYSNNDEITDCKECQEMMSDQVDYPCPTIQAIEKELK